MDAIRRAGLALVVGLLLAVALPAAAPPPRLTPAQREQLVQRNRWLQQALALFRGGKMDEAIAAIQKGLALERAVFGHLRATSLPWLEDQARLQEQRERFAEATEARQELLHRTEARHGRVDWRVTDARLDLEDTRRLARLDARQRQQLRQADQWNALVIRQWRQGRSKEALPLAEKVLASRRAILGENHRLTAQSWLNLGAQQAALHRVEPASRCYQQALRICKEVLGEKHPDYARGLNSLAGLYSAMGDHQAALPLYKRALRIFKEAHGEKHPDYANCLNNLARLYQGMGEHRQALPLLQRTRHIFKEVLGEKHPHYATSLNNLAMLYQELGDHQAALPLLQQVLRIFKEVLGEKHLLYTRSLNNLAGLYLMMGKYRQALPLYEQVLRIKKEVQGNKHPSYATSLSGLAMLYCDLGEHRKALPLYQQALRIHEEVLGKKHPLYANSLSNLATLYQEMGEHRQALPLYQQALRIQLEVLGEKHPLYANSLSNLATLYTNMGNPREALPLYQQNLRIRKEVQGEKHPDYATSLNNLAALYTDMGQTHRALPLWQQALGIYKEIQGEKHPNCATSLNNLALLYQDRGEPRQALLLGQQALRLCKEVLGERHPLYAASLNNLAGLYHAQGKQGAYLVLSGQAVALIQAHIDDSLSVLSDRQRHLLLEHRAHYLESFLCGAIGTVPAAVLYEHVAAFKDVTSTAVAEQRLARQNPNLRPLLDELCDVRSQLARLSGEVPTSRGLPQWRERFDQRDRRKTELEQRLARASAEFTQLREKPTACRVAARLAAGSALVEFLCYRHHLRPVGAGRWEWERRLIAFVVRGDREPVLVQLGNADRIASAVRLWRQSVSAGNSPDPVAARLLRQRLWQPIASYLDGIDTVLIAPDGELSGLPFAALPGEKPGSFLLEYYTCGYLSSGRQLLLRSQAVEGHGLLVLGGADFGTPQRRTDPLQRPRRWKPLPGADLEARQVEAAFRARFAKSSVGVLAGKQASRDGLLVAIHKPWRYLHVATHGHFDPPRYALPPAVLGAWSVGATAGPGVASLSGSLTAVLVAQEPGVLNRERGFDPTGQRYRVQEGNPMLLCSLVLAGVNDLGEAGYLSAEEIALLDLSACELAVLSACETGAGRQAGWQGVQGLQRGFHQAGARTVVASLWNVSDPATSVLMEVFYHNLWVKKLPRLEALRQAQLAVLKEPSRVHKRRQELAVLLRKKGLGKQMLAARGIEEDSEAAVKPAAAAKGQRSPVAWWAPWVLSGDPGP
jgi:CHAT domain-containing protein/tetratricopeptide (TPR) repeat protein